MATEPNYYQVLQVDPHASQEVIDAAYRSLAKRFHPDVNRHPGAASVMKLINEAYDILRDPVKRAAYDRWLSGAKGQEARREPSQESQAPPPPGRIACDSCGRTDATLRATVFQYVVSIVILSFKRGGGAGILCSNCRTSRALLYTLISLAFGVWGVPFGILWTIEAVFVNLSGGRQPRDINGRLLRALGAYFLYYARLQEAIASLKASLQFEENAEVRDVLKRFGPAAAKQPFRAPSRTPTAVVLAIFAVAGLTVAAGLCLIVAALYVPPQGEPRSNAMPTNAHSPVPSLLHATAGNAETSAKLMRVCVPSADMRAGPGPEFPLLTKASEGEELMVYGIVDGWYDLGQDQQGNRYYTYYPSLCADAQPSSPLPTATSSSRSRLPAKMWVCVELAYGYEEPNMESPVVFQMSQRDGWSVWVYNQYGNWYEVDNGPKLAYMLQSSLCTNPPQVGPSVGGATCSDYTLPDTPNITRWSGSGQGPIRGITRPNGIKVYFDIADAEYWDPHEQGASTYFSCPSLAQASGFSAAHPK